MSGPHSQYTEGTSRSSPNVLIKFLAHRFWANVSRMNVYGKDNYLTNGKNILLKHYISIIGFFFWHPEWLSSREKLCLVHAHLPSGQYSSRYATSTLFSEWTNQVSPVIYYHLAQVRNAWDLEKHSIHSSGWMDPVTYVNRGQSSMSNTLIIAGYVLGK